MPASPGFFAGGGRFSFCYFRVGSGNFPASAILIFGPQGFPESQAETRCGECRAWPILLFLEKNWLLRLSIYGSLLAIVTRIQSGLQMKSKLRLLLLSSCCWPCLVHGLGIRIADQDPLATARGNAFVATADNPSAIYYNPAGITQLEGQNFRAGFYAITLHSAYTAQLTGTESDTKDEVQVAPQVFFVCSPKEQPLSYGLGFYSPYGLGLEWPDNTGIRTFATKARIT